MIYKGKSIVRHSHEAGFYKYEVIHDVNDHAQADCIIIKWLDPDFVFLLDKIHLIITERGSPIAHLALISMEYHISIILVPEIVNKISKNGKLTVCYENKTPYVTIR